MERRQFLITNLLLDSWDKQEKVAFYLVVSMPIDNHQSISSSANGDGSYEIKFTIQQSGVIIIKDIWS